MSEQKPDSAQDRQTWLVTGGTGFIGQALVRSLIADGHNVIAPGRNPDRARRVLGDGVEIAALDSIQPDRTIDVIVNMAGEPLMGGPWTNARVERFFSSRLGTTEQLVALVAGLEVKPRVFLSGSAIGFYGTASRMPLEEHAPAGPDMMADLCRRWEDRALAMNAHGVRTVLMRTGLVLDSDGGMLKPLALAARMGMGAVLGDGTQGQSWISRHDYLRLLRFVIDHETLAGPVNGTAPNPVSQREFVDTLAAHFGRPRFIRTPAAMLRLPMGQMSALFLEGQYVVPHVAEASGFRFDHPTLAEALAAIYGD